VSATQLGGCHPRLYQWVGLTLVGTVLGNWGEISITYVD